MKAQNRRTFLQFLGRTSLVVGAGGSLASLTGSCDTPEKPTELINQAETEVKKIEFPIKALVPNTTDELDLSEGLAYQLLIQWEDPISENEQFGFNNDYLAYLPFSPDQPDEGILWVNHEYLDPLFVHGFDREKPAKEKSKEAVEKEMLQVGGSILHIKKNEENKWELVQDEKINRRLNAFTKIPFEWDEAIMGATEAMGTFGNCAGGVTPWGTVLTCEENYQDYYGENDCSKDLKNPEFIPSWLGWEYHYKENKPEHYGWVVEVNLKTGEAKKLVALGRCAHECAQVHQASDGRLVVYTGDDKNDEHIYKFISKNPGSLKEGTLYVANTEKGEWLSLDYETQDILKENFANQTEVLIRLREAAKLVGATPLNRPEDIEFDPMTGNVLVTLTNNIPKGDFLGKILKIEEANKDKTSTKFKAETYLAGGPELGFACPDNMAFDPRGNLWFTSDISGSKIGKVPYTEYGNNGLFVYDMQNELVVQVASAPKDAELTGPYFSPDGRSLFLSVQHPGETTQSLDALSSNWPNGGGEIPRSAVVAISGPALDKLMGYDS